MITYTLQYYNGIEFKEVRFETRREVDKLLFVNYKDITEKIEKGVNVELAIFKGTERMLFKNCILYINNPKVTQGKPYDRLTGIWKTKYN